VLENDPVYNIDAFTESTIVFRRNTSDPGTIFKTVNPRLTYKLLDSNVRSLFPLSGVSAQYLLVSS